MTRKNGGAVETCQHMDYVKMITRRMAIEGEWFTVQIHTHDDGKLRLEVVHDIKDKFYKMYPDNLIDPKEK